MATPCEPGSPISGFRPEIISATTRPEPQASVQPRWPWPALTQSPLTAAAGPMMGVPAGLTGLQPGPDSGLGAIEMARQLGEGEAGIGDDRLGPRDGRRGVVAGDLRRARDAHAVADRDEAEELAVVDDGYLRGRIPAAAREGDRDALHRIDRDADAELAEERRGEAAERDDDRVGGDAARVGRHPGHLALRRFDALDGGAVVEACRRAPRRRQRGLA